MENTSGESPLDLARRRIRSLQDELEQTNRGMLALSAELENEIEVLERSEASYRLLVEDAVFGICRCDYAGELLAVNRALVELLGFDSTEELLIAGKAGRIFSSRDDRLLLIETLRAQGQLKGLEMYWVGKKGQDVAVRVSGRLIALTDAIGGVELLVEDISESRALEEQLRQSQKMEAVGRLAGGVAHDFNNLLTSILGNAEVLSDALPEGGENREEVDEILHAGRRAAALTRQLLAFSRQRMGRPEIVDPNAVIGSLYSMLRRIIGEDVVLETLLGETLGSVRIESSQLEQIVMNLVLNAREAMPTGGRILIQTSRKPPPLGLVLPRSGNWSGQCVRISVSDTGLGMSREVCQRIFEPFFTTKDAGTGLGLAMVYGIVDGAGGQIDVQSTLGVGARFDIYLPESTLAPTDDASEETEVGLTGTERVLVVEDEEGVRRLICRTLERYGYQVLDAADADEARLLLERNEIDLLVTDIRLPGESGLGLARACLEHRRGLKVIFISGYAEEVVGDRSDLPHGSEFLAKPFSTKTLARQIRSLLS